MLSLTGGLGEGAAEAVTAVTAAAARFTVAAGFMAEVVSGAFAAGVSGTSTEGVLGAFTAIAVFSAIIVFSFPVSVSMGTRGGGIGVIPTILTITPIWITGPITTINIGTVQPRLFSRNPSDPPSTMARLSSSSTQATPGPWIQGPILPTSIAATVRPTRKGNRE